MATIRISVAEAARDFEGLLARVREGEEIIIESDSAPVAVLRPPAPRGRTVAEILAALPKNSLARIDKDFAADIAAAVNAHREPLSAPEWD